MRFFEIAHVYMYIVSGQNVYACARVYYSTVFSIIIIHTLCDDFFVCACIHYHSYTYIRHRDKASKLLRHTSVKTRRGFALQCFHYVSKRVTISHRHIHVYTCALCVCTYVIFITHLSETRIVR